jgi:hypothetical protein
MEHADTKSVPSVELDHDLAVAVVVDLLKLADVACEGKCQRKCRKKLNVHSSARSSKDV